MSNGGIGGLDEMVLAGSPGSAEGASEEWIGSKADSFNTQELGPKGRKVDGAASMRRSERQEHPKGYLKQLTHE